MNWQQQTLIPWLITGTYTRREIERNSPVTRGGGRGEGDRPNKYVKEMKFDDSLILCLFVYLFFCFKGYRFSFKYERVL